MAIEPEEGGGRTFFAASLSKNLFYFFIFYHLSLRVQTLMTKPTNQTNFVGPDIFIAM